MELSTWDFIDSETPIHERTERQNHVTNFDVERLRAEINQRNVHRRFLLADQSGDRVEANKLMYFFCATIEVVMVKDNAKRWIRGKRVVIKRENLRKVFSFSYLLNGEGIRAHCCSLTWRSEECLQLSTHVICCLFL